MNKSAFLWMGLRTPVTIASSLSLMTSGDSVRSDISAPVLVGGSVESMGCSSAIMVVWAVEVVPL